MKNLVKIISVDVKSTYARQLEKILKEWVPDYFIEDFHGPTFLCHPASDSFEILVILENEICVGGALISESVVFNEFLSPEHSDVSKKLQNTGYKNFCYFSVQEDNRGKGYGKLVIQHLVKSNAKYWLTCSPHLSNFYIKNGFDIALKACKSSNSILTFK
ncbi:GNAT family N-acetyltransferase [Leucothrix arctica]|uniref:N-acetyltransferase domain-containing protein n=1 Tax=Leucothrix arctica TaxID=1481894 RepID=A0A317C5L3_9GAMM|nr:GNAT family N-acetyltransferase [Leucothrix arctica]PWQ93884.1 hypothetical protein DKT75_19990 [Leucothrix arctica]